MIEDQELDSVDASSENSDLEAESNTVVRPKSELLPYQCEFCSGRFSTACELLIHSKTHARLRKTTNYCQECGEVFHSTFHFRNHMVNHTKEKPFQCPFCRKTFAFKHNLTNHVKTHSRPLNNPNIPDTDVGHGLDEEFETETMSSSIIGPELDDSSADEALDETETPIDDTVMEFAAAKQNIVFTCEICTRCFTTDMGLRIHIGRSHGNMNKTPQSSTTVVATEEAISESDPDPRMTMECSSDTLTLVTNNTAETDTLTQENATSDNLEFECEFCNRSFVSVAVLLIHQRLFHGGKRKTCKICLKRYRDNHKLDIHMLQKHPVKKTSVCCAQLPNSGIGIDKVTLANHLEMHGMQTADEPKSEIPEVTSSTDLEQDSTVASDSKYTCKIEKCSQTFNTFPDFMNHVKTHGLGITCVECGKMFKTNFAVKMHMLASHKAQDHFFPCGKCKRYFTRYRYLARHLSTTHKDKSGKKFGKRTANIAKENVTLSVSSVAGQSEESESTASKYSDHEQQPAVIVTKSTNLPFKCQDCNRRFSTSFGLKIHMKIHTNSEFRMLKKCPKCKKLCRTNWHLQKHMKSHKKFPLKSHSFSFQCPYCVMPMRFPFQSQLMLHCQVHHNSERLDSKTLGGVRVAKLSRAATDSISSVKSASVSASVPTGTTEVTTQGKITAEEAQPFRCDACDRSFQTSFGLFIHSKVHSKQSGLRREHTPKNAPVDDFLPQSSSPILSKSPDFMKEFIKPQSVVDTVSIPKDLPIKCPNCSRSFRTDFGLNVHIRKAHMGSEIKRLRKCQKCGKVFGSQTHLQEHITTHGDEFPLKAYQCPRCQLRFSLKERLITHAQIEHNIQLMSEEIREFVPFPKQITVAETNTSPIEPDTGIPNNDQGWEDFHFCQICDKRFESSIALLTHSRSHTGARSVSGSPGTPTKASFQQKSPAPHTVINERRLSSSPKSRPNISPASKPDKNNIPCKFCDRNFQTSTGMLIHITRKHPKYRKWHGIIKTYDKYGKNFRSLPGYRQNMLPSSSSSNRGTSVVSSSRSTSSGGSRSAHSETCIGTSNSPRMDSRSGSGLSINSSGDDVSLGDSGRSSSTTTTNLDINYPDVNTTATNCNISSGYSTASSHSSNGNSPNGNCRNGNSINGNDTALIDPGRGKSLNQKIYPCPICEKVFIHKTNLIDHFKTHAPRSKTQETPAEALPVSAKTDTSPKLQIIRHAKSFTPMKNQLFQCQVCSKTFPLRHQLMLHARVHEVRPQKEVHPCLFCGKVFLYQSGLELHMVTHTREKAYQCSLCKKEFAYSSELNAHSKNKKCLVVISPKKSPFRCKTCSRCFDHKAGLARHVMVHNRAENMQDCGICGKAFTSLAILLMHMKSHSHNQNQNETVVGSVNTEPKKLTEKTTTPSKTYTCPDCGKVYLSMCGFRYHCTKLKHKMVPKITVSVPVPESTSNTLDSSSSLQREKPAQIPVKNAILKNQYKCKICKKNFVTGGALYLHKRSHKGIKFHQYKIHGTNEPARAAEKSVKGIPEKNYNRVLAVKSGGKSGQLTMKLKRNKQLQCNICDKTLSSSQSLIIHLKSHLGIREHTCKICNKSFTLKQNLQRHILALHPAEAE